MSYNLEKRKLSIVELLSETEDVTVIIQIENLLKPKVDFWDELTTEEKESVMRGMKDLDEGRKISYKEFRNEFRKS